MGESSFRFEIDVTDLLNFCGGGGGGVGVDLPLPVHSAPQWPVRSGNQMSRDTGGWWQRWLQTGHEERDDIYGTIPL